MDSQQTELPQTSAAPPEQEQLGVIEPLCAATRDIFKPIALQADDRLHLSINKNGTHFVARAFAQRPGGIRGGGSWAACRGWVDRLPGGERTENAGGGWTLAATDFTVVVIYTLWGMDRLVFEDSRVELVFKYLLGRLLQQNEVAKVKADFKINKVMPPAPSDWLEHGEHPLADYQRVGCWTTVGVEAALLNWEQGTGKTPTTIARIMHEARLKHAATGQAYHAIVVCPKNVRSNWLRELSKFATVPGRAAILRGGQLKRVKQMVEIASTDPEEAFGIAICSYETVIRSWPALQLFEWDLAVADESHLLKSVSARRSRFMLNLRDRSKQRMALTGTFMANSVVDAYYQLEFLGEGMSGFSSWQNFRKYYSRFAETEEEGAITSKERGKKVIGVKNIPVLQERLARIAFKMTKKEALPSLPDKVYDVEEAQMGKAQAEVYRKVAAQLAAEIEGDIARALDSGKAAMTISNVLTKLLRLSQITAGFATVDAQYDDDGKALIAGRQRVKFFDDVPKMRRVIEVAKSKGPAEKLIVWCVWIPAIERMSQLLTEAGVKHVVYTGDVKDDERDRIVKAFNEDPSVKVFVGNPGAGGVGINLPGSDPSKWDKPDDLGTDADHTLYYACDWSFIKRSQSEDRNHGKGRNRKPVRVTDLCVPGTIDDEIRERLYSKKEFADGVQDVRKMLARLLDPSILDDEADDSDDNDGASADDADGE